MLSKVLVDGKMVTTLQWKAVASKGLRGCYDRQKNCHIEVFSEKDIKLLIKMIAEITNVNQ